MTGTNNIYDVANGLRAQRDELLKIVKASMPYLKESSDTEAWKILQLAAKYDADAEEYVKRNLKNENADPRERKE